MWRDTLFKIRRLMLIAHLSCFLCRETLDGRYGEKSTSLQEDSVQHGKQGIVSVSVRLSFSFFLYHYIFVSLSLLSFSLSQNLSFPLSLPLPADMRELFPCSIVAKAFLSKVSIGTSLAACVGSFLDFVKVKTFFPACGVQSR